MNRKNLQSEILGEIRGLVEARVNYETLAASCGEKIAILESAQNILLGRATKVAAAALAVEVAPDAPVDWSKFDGRRLRGLSKIEAMAEMARYNGGTIRANDLADGLIYFKLASQKKRSDVISNVYGSINACPARFERVERGVYSLVS